MQILRHEFFDGRQLSLEAQRCVHTLSGQEAPRRRAAAAAAAAAVAANAPGAVVASLPGSRVNDPMFRESMTIIGNALRQALESGVDPSGLKRRCEGFADGLKKTNVAAGEGADNGDPARLAKRPREEPDPVAQGVHHGITVDGTGLMKRPPTVGPPPQAVSPATAALPPPPQAMAPMGVPTPTMPTGMTAAAAAASGAPQGVTEDFGP